VGPTICQVNINERTAYKIQEYKCLIELRTLTSDISPTGKWEHNPCSSKTKNIKEKNSMSKGEKNISTRSDKLIGK
jgi:hypothetical protein